MACGHLWRKMNDVRVCMKCGLTVGKDGRVLVFDRRLRDVVTKPEKRIKKRKKKMPSTGAMSAGTKGI